MPNNVLTLAGIEPGKANHLALTIQNRDGYWWNGSTGFELYNSSNINLYQVTLSSEQGSIGSYQFVVPTSITDETVLCFQVFDKGGTGSLSESHGPAIAKGAAGWHNNELKPLQIMAPAEAHGGAGATISLKQFAATGPGESFVISSSDAVPFRMTAAGNRNAGTISSGTPASVPAIVLDGDFSFATGALKNAIVEDITQAVVNKIWNELQSGQTRPAGSYGEFLDAKVSSRLAPAVAGRTLDVSTAGEVDLQADQTGVSIGTANNVLTILTPVTVGTNNDKTGYSLADGSISDQTFAANAISASAFSQAAADKAKADVSLLALESTSQILVGRIPAGPVATQADVQSITQASRVRLGIPPQMQRPASGSVSYRIYIYHYNAQHEAEDLDSNPTVTAENNATVDRSANLGTVTKQPASTGIYFVDYTVADTHEIEGLVFKVDATEQGKTTQYQGNASVVDKIKVDYTDADRLRDDNLATRASELRLGKLDVAGDLANTANAATFQADVSLLALEATAQEIVAQTNKMTFTVTGQIDANMLKASVPVDLKDDQSTVTIGIVGNVSDKTGYEIAGAKKRLDDLNDVSTTNLAEAIENALNVATRPLPGQDAPPADATIVRALFQLYKMATNKSDQTDNLQKIYNRGGTVVDHQRVVAEAGGTTTIGEMFSGP